MRIPVLTLLAAGALTACGAGDPGAVPPTPDAAGIPSASASPADARTAEPSVADTTPPVPEAIEVAIVDFDFDPSELTVAAGTTVVWTNTGDINHTVTFTPDGPDSGVLATGERFERTFDEPGTYAYVCQLHTTMQASVTVS